MSDVQPHPSLSRRLQEAQHRLDDAELAEDVAFRALTIARKARQDAANAVFNIQESMIDALRVV